MRFAVAALCRTMGGRSGVLGLHLALRAQHLGCAASFVGMPDVLEEPVRESESVAAVEFG